MTLDESLDAEEEEGYRYELARGVLEMGEIPDDGHAQVVYRLTLGFCRHAESYPRAIRRCGGAGGFLFLLPGLGSARRPDFAVLLKGTPADPRGQRPASLAVEVVSEGGEARDYETKRQEYLAYGLREYWIVDPIARKVTVLARDGDVWAERVFRDDQVIESLVLPGFATRVSDLWVDVDEGEGNGR